MSDWLFAVGLNVMNLLPGKGRALSLRGRWTSQFLAAAGANLKLCSHINIYHPNRVTCGDNVYIGYGTYIGGGDVTLADQVIIGPYCCIVAGNHTMRDESYRFGPYASGKIVIGRGTWLGAHVTIASGVCIGRGCLVAANSVVTHDVDDFTLVGGVPAKPIRRTTDHHADT